LGYPSLPDAHLGPALFVVAMLQSLGTTLAEHGSELLELHGIFSPDERVELLFQVQQTAEVSSVPDRKRCTASWFQTREQ